MLLHLALQTAQVTGSASIRRAEGVLIEAVEWLRLAIETAGALIICIGVVITLYKFCTAAFSLHVENYNRIRLMLARYLGLALEFQLGADILSTSIAPSWQQIGKLAAIAVIRTALNYFLNQEMQEERATNDRTR
jgi:uncharacterized membrane protein